jgi:hypothetical protein
VYLGNQFDYSINGSAAITNGLSYFWNADEYVDASQPIPRPVSGLSSDNFSLLPSKCHQLSTIKVGLNLNKAIWQVRAHWRLLCLCNLLRKLQLIVVVFG